MGEDVCFLFKFFGCKRNQQENIIMKERENTKDCIVACAAVDDKHSQHAATCLCTRVWHCSMACIFKISIRVLAYEGAVKTSNRFDFIGLTTQLGVG